MDGPAPKIALVAATYRRPKALATLLRSLATQVVDPTRFEVGIVVDGHDEFEQEYRAILDAARESASFSIAFGFQENAGPSVAREHAIQLTSAPLLCIVDDDMDLDPRFLEAHLAALTDGGDDTVVIGRVVPEDDWKTQPLYEAFRTSFMLRMHEDYAAGRRSPGPAAFVTQNVSLSRSLYSRVGGLDPQFRLGEDTELGFRLKAAGARLTFCSAAAAVHRSRIGSYESWLARQVDYGRCAYTVYEKLGRSPDAHPLRNLVTGSRLKSAAVHATCWSEPVASVAMNALRRSGKLLQQIRLFEPAVATYQAIHAIAYHVGIKQTLGSWSAVLKEKRAFASQPDRPLEPT